MIRIAIVLTLAAAACGPREPGDEPGPAPLRLCVQNQAPAHGNIIARAGLVRFDVLPGQEVCKRVTLTGVDIPLRAQTTGGGLSGPVSYAERLQPAGYRCWRWRLTGSSASAADLTPCEEEFEASTDTVVETVEADTLPGRSGR
jgi:hypothetical protein